MDRIKFIKMTAGLLPIPFLSGSLLAGSSKAQSPEPDAKITVCPPYLKKGDQIGITSPSGYIFLNELLPAIKQLNSWGLQVKIGRTIGQRDGTFGGTDALRVQDFQEMLDDSAIKAILCARGGYGAIRIIDKIDFSRLRANPKWVIGFSDATVFHCHIATHCHVATLHSKMCNSFPDDWEKAPALQKDTILSIRDALMHTGKMEYKSIYNIYNRTGRVEGDLIGGNLRTIENLSGTPSGIQAAGKILFLEETHEYLYNMDRMLWNLKRSGQLSHLKGLIIGAMVRQQQRNPADELNRSIYDLVSEKTKTENFPITFDFPVGHIINNFALKCGIRHTLEVSRQGTRLIEI
ncbi:MAG TPA: LD-carboxypeptidase [Arachidicoccus sp.]|nr:LD-carboxypeptidase [Arachidicoccus sp.]